MKVNLRVMAKGHMMLTKEYQMIEEIWTPSNKDAVFEDPYLVQYETVLFGPVTIKVTWFPASKIMAEIDSSFKGSVYLSAKSIRAGVRSCRMNIYKPLSKNFLSGMCEAFLEHLVTGTPFPALETKADQPLGNDQRI